MVHDTSHVGDVDKYYVGSLNPSHFELRILDKFAGEWGMANCTKFYSKDKELQTS